MEQNFEVAFNQANPPILVISPSGTRLNQCSGAHVLLPLSRLVSDAMFEACEMQSTWQQGCGYISSVRGSVGPRASLDATNGCSEVNHVVM